MNVKHRFGLFSIIYNWNWEHSEERKAWFLSWINFKWHENSWTKLITTFSPSSIPNDSHFLFSILIFNSRVVCALYFLPSIFVSDINFQTFLLLACDFFFRLPSDILFRVTTFCETFRLKTFASGERKGKENWLSCFIFQFILIVFESFPFFFYYYDGVEWEESCRVKEKQNRRKICMSMFMNFTSFFSLNSHILMMMYCKSTFQQSSSFYFSMMSWLTICRVENLLFNEQIIEIRHRRSPIKLACSFNFHKLNNFIFHSEIHNNFLKLVLWWEKQRE